MSYEPADEALVEQAAALVQGARRVAVLTGAGISTDAGIPDFRGPAGVWTLNPGAERRATLRAYLEDEELRRSAWRQRLDSPVWAATPTPAHLALLDLERRQQLHTLVTQNTDGLHRKAGTSPGLLVEIHGTAHFSVCWECGHRQPTPDVLERVRSGEEDPHCLEPSPRPFGAPPALPGALCGGILKAATVSFGQSIDPDDLARAQIAAAESDLLLCIGTTLEVQPIAGMVPLAERAGAAIVIVNGSPTAGDGYADVVVRGPISEVVPAIVS